MEKINVHIFRQKYEIEIQLDNLDSDFHFFFLSTFGVPSSGKYIVDISSFINDFHLINLYFGARKSIYKVIFADDLKQYIFDIPNHTKLINIQHADKDELLEKLKLNNFQRDLKHFQLANVLKILNLRCAADFSVPGAGKTTDALAYYTFHRKEDVSKLLIISPLNAFPAWEEDTKKCLGEDKKVLRLRGEIEELQEILSTDNEFFIINYESLFSDRKLELLRDFFSFYPESTLILDESHRSKGEKISERLKKISQFPKRKLILTGTPMPQSPKDLESQFSFLYPLHSIIEEERFIEEFQPFYIRTNDKDLGLKPLIEESTYVKPYSGQKEFYDQYIDRPLSKGIDIRDIVKTNSLKKAYMRLLKFISNPILEIEFIKEINSDLADRIELEQDGAKIDAVISRARELALAGEKVLIWSSFIANVRTITRRLAPEFGAEYIIGEVKTEDGEQDEDWNWLELETREAIIKRFKENDSTRILVANPAAAAESMSLHNVCSHALYLDRTYNAGQFLQSQKRIHRLTEGEDMQKKIEIFCLNVRGSIDFHIDRRLAEKCHEMYKFLNESEISMSWVNLSQDKYYENLGSDSDFLDYQSSRYNFDFYEEE